jgi:hypothetical protein
MASFWRRLLTWAFPPEDPHAVAALDGGPGPEPGCYLVHDVAAPPDVLPPSAALAAPEPVQFITHVTPPPTGDPDAAPG